MSANHTPGPWDFTQDGSTAKKLATVCVTGDGWIVGVPFSRETDVNYEQHGTSKADARLIASAPDLLEALKAVMEGCEWREIQGCEAWHTKQMPSSEALTKARAAIAKATGSAT